MNLIDIVDKLKNKRFISELREELARIEEKAQYLPDEEKQKIIYEMKRGIFAITLLKKCVTEGYDPKEFLNPNLFKT